MDSSLSKIAVMQPYVFPYLGYFQLINAVDEFVFYDDVSFIKRGWINRNRILSDKDSKLISFPCKSISQNKFIKDIQIDLDSKDYLNIRKTISQAYKKAPYYLETLQVINQVFKLPANNISDFAINSVKLCCEYLDIQIMFSVSSKDYSEFSSLKRNDRLVKITKKSGSSFYINPIGGQDLYSKQYFKKNGIDLFFLKPNLPAYKQFKNEFVTGLSIIDVMMFNSPEKIRSMLNQYALI